MCIWWLFSDHGGAAKSEHDEVPRLRQLLEN
jgi:hypothetical protein